MTTMPQEMHARRTAASRRLWRWTGLLAFAALACAVLLTGVSAWFLASVALAGTTAAAFAFNFHIPAALVRIFAVGRTAAKYGERLAGHKAALTDQVGRRIALFRAMAATPAIRRAGWQFGDQDRLADYIDDVEDLDFAKLRIDLPALTAIAGLLACLIATIVVTPLAAAPIAAAVLMLLAFAWHCLASGETHFAEARRLRRSSAQDLSGAMASVVPLKAEGAWSVLLDTAFSQAAKADDHVLGAKLRFSGFDGLASLFGPFAAFCVFGAAWLSGARSEALLIPVFVAFAWLAFGETINGLSRVIVAVLRRHLADREIGRVTHAQRPLSPATPPLRIASLSMRHLQRRAPDGRPIGTAISAHFDAGHPTILTGASGCGKTSLLKQIAGWIGDDVMTSGSTLLLAPAREAVSFFCPHDAAVLSDSVRANLFAPQASDEELRHALDAVELLDRIDRAGGLDAWITQDVFSLGEAQRLNLARTFLSDRPLVLLDEPTEHLDADQAERILSRLLARLSSRVVVLSSHRALHLPGAKTIRLSAHAR